jgi:hypothetical protein
LGLVNAADAQLITQAPPDWMQSPPKLQESLSLISSAQKNAPATFEAAGALYQCSYLVVAGAAAFFFFLLLCFFVAGFDASAAGAAAAGASAAIGAAAFGISAAIAAAARPKVINADVIKVPDLFMRSPNGGINKHFKEYASIHPFHPR